VTETVTRLRGTEGTDAYGTPSISWASPAELDIPNTIVAPRMAAGDELARHGRQGVIVGLTIYPPSGSDIGYRDRVRVRGAVYEVEGEPGDWRNPFTGDRPGMEVALRRVEG
jgi:hypothetical protein